MSRQRSPVRVAAASSLSAAFLAPLIATRARAAAGRPRPGRPPGRPAPGCTPSGTAWHQPWSGPSRAAADPRGVVARRRGSGGAPAAAGRGRPTGRRPRGSRVSSARSASRRASWAFSRSISLAMSAVSAMTTTLSGRTWRKPPTIANDFLLAALADAQLADAERRDERRVMRQHAELALRPGQDDRVDRVRVGQPLRRDDLELDGHGAQPASLAAFSRTSSTVPARKNACSGRVSVLPSRISLNEATVSLIDT